MTTDYDHDLDIATRETPEEYACEDENEPLYIAENIPLPEDQASL